MSDGDIIPASIFLSDCTALCRLLADECERFVKAPCSPLPATHGLMAAVMRDPFQLFKYYSCCQGDKDIIVEEFSKDEKKVLSAG